jgi:membrane-bound lytic murein transglycosylase D
LSLTPPSFTTDGRPSRAARAVAALLAAALAFPPSVPLSLRAEEPPAEADAPELGADPVALDAAEPPVEPAPGEPAPALPTPKWLSRAQAEYEAGVKALEAGRHDDAEDRFKAALRQLSHKNDDLTFLSLKDELGALFADLHEQLLRKAEAAAQGLEVSEQELAAAPTAEVPPGAQAAPHTIPLDPDNPLVRKYVGLYTGHRRKNMEQALARLAVHRDMILRQLQEAGLPRELLYLPIAESEVKNTATSRAGAVGLWQIMPGTGRRSGLKVNYWLDERRDPEKSTRAALKYLKDLHAWFDDWHLALAAYNRGEYGIERDMSFSRSPDFEALARRGALPGETQHYVPKFMACVIIAENAETYGFRPEPSAPIVVDEVTVSKPLDLKVAADCAGTTEEVLKELNPALRLWCTPKNEPLFALRIPAGAKDRFVAALARVKEWTPSRGEIKYRVKKGDMLGNIARRYKTTVTAIQRANDIRDPRTIRPGRTLIIRPGSRYKGD